MKQLDFNVELVRVRLDCPMKSTLHESTANLRVVLDPIEAALTGKTYTTNELKRIPAKDLMVVKTDSLGMVPGFYVVCHPHEVDQAAKLIHEHLLRWLAPVVNFYKVVDRAAKAPLQIMTRKEFMASLNGGKAFRETGVDYP